MKKLLVIVIGISFLFLGCESTPEPKPTIDQQLKHKYYETGRFTIGNQNGFIFLLDTKTGELWSMTQSNKWVYFNLPKEQLIKKAADPLGLFDTSAKNK